MNQVMAQLLKDLAEHFAKETVKKVEKHYASKREEIEAAVRETGESGTVAWFEHGKGYGFIEPDSGGEEVFVHFTKILCQNDTPTLREGARVKFIREHDKKGDKVKGVIEE